MHCSDAETNTGGVARVHELACTPGAQTVGVQKDCVDAVLGKELS
jgi:hypothetical protein